MKISNTIAAMAAICITLSSCSMYNSVFKKGESDDSAKIVKTEVSAPKASKKNKKDKNKKEQSISKSSKPQTNVKPTVDELTGGEWTVTGVGDVKIETEENVPYVNFARDNRFYASDGCNIINGSYVLQNDGTILFSSVLSTMKYCAEVEYSALIASMFNDGARLAVDCRRIGQETYLYFKNKKGNTLMTLRRHNMEFLNGNWKVTAIDGKEINDDEANIFIDIAELKVHGNTGCNHFNGELYIDPMRSNAIDFSNMGLTRMACYKGDQERMMMVALEEAKTAIAGKNDDTVLLLNRKGKEVMQLKRIPIVTE